MNVWVNIGVQAEPYNCCATTIVLLFLSPFLFSRYRRLLRCRHCLAQNRDVERYWQLDLSKEDVICLRPKRLVVQSCVPFERMIREYDTITLFME